MGQSQEPRKWEQPFLDALRAGESLAGAARVAGIHRTTPGLHAARSARFAAEMEFARTAPRKRAPASVPAPRKMRNKIEIFLERLAATSNVAASAELAELSPATVYRLRRTDPEFARRWYAALAEGYDNLEMEVLARLRAGGERANHKGTLDVAAALRCLAAHRESVAREKGRRTLAEEVATIAAINAKIDRLRLAGEQADAMIAKARAGNAARRAAAARRKGRGGAR